MPIRKLRFGCRTWSTIDVHGLVCRTRDGATAQKIHTNRLAIRHNLFARAKLKPTTCRPMMLATARVFLTQRAAKRLTEQILGNSLGTSAYISLGDLIIRITHADEREALFDAVARHIPRILVADRASVALLLDNGEEAEVHALEGSKGAMPRGVHLPLATTLIGEVVNSEQTTAWPVNSVGHYTDAAALAELGVQWIVNAPLHDREGVIGTINIASKSPDPYPSDDIALLNQIASLVSATLQRQRLMTTTRQAAERTQAYAEKLVVLNHIAHRLSTAMNEREVFNTAAEGMHALVQCERISLAVLTEDELHCRVSMLSGSDDVLGRDAKLALDGASLYRVFQTGKATYWSEFEPDTYCDHALLKAIDLNSGISLPITRRGRVFAALNLAANRIHPFTAEDRAVLTMFASLMSVTIDRVYIAEMLEHQARRDPLTGLANRREFDRVLAEALEQAQEGSAPMSLCFIDVDHFKTINDSFGHHAGDVLLKGIVEQMLSVLSKNDVLARVGGDEFALLLSDCALADAMRVAERLRAIVDSHVSSFETHHFSVSLSIGIAEISPGDTTSEVIFNADSACYLSKEAGRNRVTAAREEAHRVRRKRSEAQQVNLIKRSLAEGGFQAFAQPIWLLPKMRVVAYELLVRMVDDDGKLLSPASFIPIAERYGLVTGIDQWMFEQAVAWVSNGPGAKCRQICTINISSTSLESETFLNAVLSTLRASDTPAERIGFEITESVAVAQVAKAARFIEALSSLGCRFALDDFGSGFSSFSALKSLPVDFIKIDGSLVRDVANNAIDKAAVRAIAELAKALNAGTIAEFVEDGETLNTLRALGISHAQGYGLGKPIPLHDVPISTHITQVVSIANR